MDRMPPEILQFILLELSEIEYADYESSCRAFANLAPEYLFHDVWLYMKEDSFAKLKALADHPSYRRMVRVLKIFPKFLSADLLVKEDYEAWVRGITFTGNSREGWGFGTDGKRSLSQEKLDAGFVEYSKIHEQQVEARASADRLLHYALAAFTGLGLYLDNNYGSFDATLVDIYPCALEASKKALLGLKYLTLSLEAICPVHLGQVIGTVFLANFLEYAANVQSLQVSNK